MPYFQRLSPSALSFQIIRFSTSKTPKRLRSRHNNTCRSLSAQTQSLSQRTTTHRLIMGPAGTKASPATKKNTFLPILTEIAPQLRRLKSRWEFLAEVFLRILFAGPIPWSCVFCPIYGIGIWVLRYAKEKRRFNDRAGRPDL